MVPELMMLVSSVLIGVAVGLGVIASADLVDWINGRYLADLTERMERLGMDSRPLRGLLRFRWISTIGAFLVVGLWMHMVPVGLLTAGLTYYVFGQWLENRLVKRRQQPLNRRRVADRARRYRIAVRNQLPFVVDLMALMLESGAIFRECLETAASENRGEAVGEEFSRVCRAIDQGMSQTEALRNLGRRMDDADIFEMVFAINTAEERGTRLKETLSDQRAWFHGESLQPTAQTLLLLCIDDGTGTAASSAPSQSRKTVQWAVILLCLPLAVVLFLLPSNPSGNVARTPEEMQKEYQRLEAKLQRMQEEAGGGDEARRVLTLLKEARFEQLRKHGAQAFSFYHRVREELDADLGDPLNPRPLPDDVAGVLGEVRTFVNQQLIELRSEARKK